MEDEIITAHNTCIVEKSNVRHAEINAIDKLMDKRGREKNRNILYHRALSNVSWRNSLEWY